jgi:hypothetical protein
VVEIGRVVLGACLFGLRPRSRSEVEHLRAEIRRSEATLRALWLPTPPEGHEVRIGVFVARTLQHGVIDVPGFTLFAGERVPNGIAAVLIRETRPIEPQHGADLEHAVSHILTIVREKGTNLSAPRWAINHRIRPRPGRWQDRLRCREAARGVEFRRAP